MLPHNSSTSDRRDLAATQTQLAGPSSLHTASFSHYLGGYALHLHFDGRPVRCLFDSLDSAKAFRRFSEIYVNESQAGNSSAGFFPPQFVHGAHLEPQRVLFPRPGNYFDIWPQTVSNMFHAICARRLIIDHEAALHDPSVGYEKRSEPWKHAEPRLIVRKGYTFFSFQESALPPRIPPTELGQFVAAVDDPKFRRENAYFIGNFGTKALIALVRFSEKPCLEKLVFVNPVHLMRIHDFYQENEYRREECGYRRLKEELIEFALSCIQKGASIPDSTAIASKGLLEQRDTRGTSTQP